MGIGEGEGAVAGVNAVETDAALAVERAGLDDAVGQHARVAASGGGFAGFVEDFHLDPGFDEAGCVDLLDRRFDTRGPGIGHGAGLGEQDPLAALDGLIQCGAVDSANAALDGRGEEGQFIDLAGLPHGALQDLPCHRRGKGLFSGAEIALSQGDIPAAGDL